MASLGFPVTVPDTGNIAPSLTNLSTGISGADQDVYGRRLPEGQSLWIIEPSRQALAVVDRVDGLDVVLAGSVQTPAFAAGTRVLVRDFALTVREQRGGALTVVETHQNLSLVPSNLRNFAPNRVNLGTNPSTFIRIVDCAGTGVPIGNASFTNLSGISSDPDGRVDLGPNDYIGSPASGTGLSALDGVDEISTLVVPYPRFDPAVTGSEADLDLALRQVYNGMSAYCERRRYLFCVLDSKPGQDSTAALGFRNALTASNHAAFYWPWIEIVPEGLTRRFPIPPSGAIAGIFADVDRRRGVHKAPAGSQDGRLKSARGVERVVTKAEQDGLNLYGVNVLRSFPDSGLNIWGARTLSTSAEWRYVNVRRLFNFIEKSIDDGTQWVVFEPNNAELWARIQRSVAGFLRGVWRSGALFGETEDRAFRVKCDAETNTTETIELGQVITEIRVAAVKPAEFVIFRIRQMASGAEISE
jgi:hypothetical protein